MKYFPQFNQLKALEWNLSLGEAHVFGWLYECASWADSLILGGHTFYFASRNKCLKEMPILSRKGNPDTIYRHYKSLQAKGLISLKKLDSKDYVALTQKGKEWYEGKERASQDARKKSQDSEKFPNGTGKISEKHSEKFPTNNNTSLHPLPLNKAATDPPNLKPEPINFLGINELKEKIKNENIKGDLAGRLKIWALIEENRILETPEFKGVWSYNNGGTLDPVGVVKDFVMKSDLVSNVLNLSFNKIGPWIKSARQNHLSNGKGKSRNSSEASPPDREKYGNFKTDFL